MKKFNTNDQTIISNLKENPYQAYNEEFTPEMIVAAYENSQDHQAMYAFYDTKSKSYDTPFFCKNDLFAKRHYKMITEKEGTLINNFIEDFELHRIGYFDIKDGTTVDVTSTIVKYNKKENNK